MPTSGEVRLISFETGRSRGTRFVYPDFVGIIVNDLSECMPGACLEYPGFLGKGGLRAYAHVRAIHYVRCSVLLFGTRHSYHKLTMCDPPLLSNSEVLARIRAQARGDMLQALGASLPGGAAANQEFLARRAPIQFSRSY